MPRPNPTRTLGNERALAKRLAWERARRTPPMTYDGLAARMTEVGCPIQGSALYKIEKSGRRITVDELVAMAKVFEVDVADLLRPLEAVMFKEIERVVEREAAASDTVLNAASELYEALTARCELWRRAIDEGDEELENALRSLFGYGPDGLHDALEAEVQERFPERSQRGPGRPAVDYATDAVEELFYGLYDAATNRVWPPGHRPSPFKQLW